MKIKHEVLWAVRRAGNVRDDGESDLPQSQWRLNILLSAEP